MPEGDPAIGDRLDSGQPRVPLGLRRDHLAEGRGRGVLQGVRLGPAVERRQRRTTGDADRQGKEPGRGDRGTLRAHGRSFGRGSGGRRTEPLGDLDEHRAIIAC
jgi:hypothetical protein